MIVMGAILNEIGSRTPIIKDYLGGGVIAAIFGSAALSTYKINPQDATDLIIGFMKNKSAFLNFYIAALITGSILGTEYRQSSAWRLVFRQGEIASSQPTHLAHPFANRESNERWKEKHQNEDAR